MWARHPMTKRLVAAIIGAWVLMLAACGTVTGAAAGTGGDAAIDGTG
jgi:hypothetical protein